MPSSSHVTSGLSGSSLTAGACPGGGHWNVRKASMEAWSGFSIHFSGWSTRAPPPGAGAGDGEVDSVGLGEAGWFFLSFLSFLPFDSRTGARFFEFDSGEGLAPGFWVTPEPPWTPAAAQGPGLWWLQATRRKRSCAWRLTVSTRSRRLWPGISTTTCVSDWVVTSASVTPVPLTRASMIVRASSSDSASGEPLAISVIRVPPCRSRPSSGFQVPASATRP